METLTFEKVKTIIGERKPTTNKGDNGRGLILAGSELMSGAAVMCAAASLRAGVGTLKAVVPSGARPAFYALPECMCISLGENGWDDDNDEFLSAFVHEATAVCIGPGMGKGDGVKETLILVLEAGKPTIIDADGLNALSRIEDKASILHTEVLLTPHIGEMARLTGLSTGEIKSNQESVAKHYAKEWGCTVLLKSYESVIACHDGRAALNTNGNAGLAKGGSGDVLSGIALAMLSQGLDTFNAACAAAYILGASADDAVKLLKERMLLSRDVVGSIEQTLKEMF